MKLNYPIYVQTHPARQEKLFPPKLITHIALKVNRMGEKYIPRGGGQTPLLVLFILLVLVLVIVVIVGFGRNVLAWLPWRIERIWLHEALWVGRVDGDVGIDTGACVGRRGVKLVLVRRPLIVDTPMKFVFLPRALSEIVEEAPKHVSPVTEGEHVVVDAA